MNQVFVSRRVGNLKMPSTPLPPQRFFSDNKLSRMGKILTILELVSIHLIARVSSDKHRLSTAKSVNVMQFSQAKSLMQYVH